MSTNLALRISGIVALCTAFYHAYGGETIIRSLEINPSEQIGFVRATYHIGTMGWIAGGVLLLAAASLTSQQARNWIVGVLTVMYGLPAFGTLALSGGRPNIGGIALAVVVVLALVGRRISPKQMED